jgi:hypothetical protein
MLPLARTDRFVPADFVTPRLHLASRAEATGAPWRPNPVQPPKPLATP